MWCWLAFCFYSSTVLALDSSALQFHAVGVEQNLGRQGVSVEIQLQELHSEFLLQLGRRIAQAVAGEDENGLIVQGEWLRKKMGEL